jgi:hypothetical protein
MPVERFYGESGVWVRGRAIKPVKYGMGRSTSTRPCSGAVPRQSSISVEFLANKGLLTPFHAYKGLLFNIIHVMRTWGGINRAYVQRFREKRGGEEHTIYIPITLFPIPNVC